jgi:mannose-6-phosphate isomerase-like protein (cupin superfamily)
MSAENRKTAVVRTGEGRCIDVAGDRYRILADSGHTAARYSLWEATISPQGGPPPHVHTREDEGFYILEGEVTFYVAGESIIAGPGTFLNATPDRPHAFRNEADIPARMLIMVAPGGMERMFFEVGTPVSDSSSPIAPFGDEEKRRLLEAAPRYGIRILPPPQHQ